MICIIPMHDVLFILHQVSIDYEFRSFVFCNDMIFKLP